MVPIIYDFLDILSKTDELKLFLLTKWLQLIASKIALWLSWQRVWTVVGINVYFEVFATKTA